MQPGQPLLVFADVEYLQMEVDVPARLRPGLQDGMMLQAELDVATDGPVRVAQIFPMATPSATQSRSSSICRRAWRHPHVCQGAGPDLTAPAREAPVIPTTAIR